MRSLLRSLPLLVLATGCRTAPTAAPAPPPATAAAAPAADCVERPPAEVQMRAYHLVILRRGPAWTAERTPEVERIGQGHMDNINRLAAEGKLLLAGPFLEMSGDPPMAGIFLFKTDSREEAEAWVATDPAVAAGRFTVEIVKWYGPARLLWE